MTDFVGELTNLFMLGEETTSSGDGEWLRNLTRIPFAGFNVELFQYTDFLTSTFSDYRGQTVITTQVRIKDLQPNRFDEALEAVQGMAQLLSFAAVSEVVLCNWEYPYPGRETVAQRWSVVSKANYFRPVIEMRRASSVRVFLEETWPAYFREVYRRKLPVAIDYFVTPEVIAMPMELELLSIFVLFENLKSTYASTKGYSYNRGCYRSSNGDKLSFRFLLEEMFHSAGMAPDLTDLVKVRNEIIHSGISQLPFDEQQSIYSSLRDIAREYFIRLLGYSGKYYTYSNRGMRSVSVKTANEVDTPDQEPVS